MRKYNLLFISALCAFTMISFSSCEDFLSIFDRQEYSESGSSYGSGDEASLVNSNQVSMGDSTLKLSAIEVQTQKMQSKQSEQDSIIDVLSNDLVNLENKNARKIESSTVYALMLLEFILVLVIFYVGIRKNGSWKKKSSNTSYDNSHNESGVTQNVVRLLIKQNIEDLTKQINTKNKKQDDAILTIENRLNKLEKSDYSYSGYYPFTKQDNEQQYSPEATTPAEKKGASTFYMPRTLTPLQFEDSKKKMSRSENTYFKFEIIREGEASFTFDPYDDTCIKKAFDDRDNSLATVCDIELKNAKPRSYINGKSGMAVLRNDIWEVTRKLKLQYV